MMPRSDSRNTTEDLISLGPCHVDLTRKEIILLNGQRRPISKLQVELLRYLAKRHGDAVTRDELLSNVWNMDPSRTLTRTVDMHISQLRRKLGEDPDKPTMLITVHGRGYALSIRSGAHASLSAKTSATV
jgi:two-component system response regulator VicR